MIDQPAPSVLRPESERWPRDPDPDGTFTSLPGLSGEMRRYVWHDKGRMPAEDAER